MQPVFLVGYLSELLQRKKLGNQMKPIWAGPFIALMLGLAGAAGADAADDDGLALDMAPTILVAQHSEIPASQAMFDEPLALTLSQSLARLPVVEVINEDGFVQGAGTAIFLSHDNENFSAQRIAVEYQPRFKHIDSLTNADLIRVLSKARREQKI